MIIKRELYDFQKEGIKYLIRRKTWSGSTGARGGFLWDDPGLGKTTQAIVAAYLIATRPSLTNGGSTSSGGYPILIVCPNALKLHWAREIRAIVPEAKGKVVVATVGGRWRKWSQSAGKSLELSPTLGRLEELGADWVIVHYAGLRVSQTAYQTIPWATVIVDESHYVKNRNARRTQALMEVTPNHANRIALTATPWSKEPSGLWAQMHWMAPQVSGLSSYWRWFGLFVDFKMTTLRRRPDGKVVESDDERLPAVRRFRKIVGGKNLDALAEVMNQYGLCRTKAQVAPQLPPITDTVMPLELTGRQKVVYDALKDRGRVEFAVKHTNAGGGVTKMVIKNVLARLTRMERWLSNPGDIDPGCRGAKMEWLEEWTSHYTYPAVIVTRFKSTARMIASALGDKAGAAPITGDIPIKRRDPIIRKWTEGGADAPQYLVGTIHTLGTGLNLQRAHTLVCFDQVHSSILMTQVRERVHRIVSDHPVEVIYLLVEDTCNELVYESFTGKWRTLELVKKFLRHLQGEDWRAADNGVDEEDVNVAIPT
jgi:SNF2 family DNA or RNA helicase